MAPKPSAEVWHSPGAGPFCNLSWTGNQDANSVGTVWTLFFINLVIWVGHLGWLGCASLLFRSASFRFRKLMGDVQLSPRDMLCQIEAPTLP